MENKKINMHIKLDTDIDTRKFTVEMDSVRIVKKSKQKGSKTKNAEFNSNSMLNLLTEADAFITNILGAVEDTKYVETEEEENGLEGESLDVAAKQFSNLRLLSKRSNDSTVEESQSDELDPSAQVKLSQRAESISMLREKLNKFKGKEGKTFDYKKNLLKKKIKNRINRKSKAEVKKLRVAYDKTVAGQSNGPVVTKVFVNPTRPLYNNEGKMVFSKFDFTQSEGKPKKKEKNSRIIKDPKKLLQRLEKSKEKIQELEASGEKEKVLHIKEKYAWTLALKKTEGEKVKDDTELLKRSIKRVEDRKKKSKKNWDNRMQTVQNKKDDAQKKRKDNLRAKKQQKKQNKIKKSIKKGRVVL